MLLLNCCCFSAFFVAPTLPAPSGVVASARYKFKLLLLLLLCCCSDAAVFPPFVTPTLPAPSGVVASARLCCLSRVPPAVCPSLLESATTVCNSFLQSLSTYVRTPTPHSISRFRPAPQTPDLHTSNLPHLTYDMIINTQLHKKSFACSMFYPYEGYRAVTSLDAGRVNRSIFHNHSVH